MAPAETIAQNLKGSIRQKTKKDDEAQYSSNLEASLRKYGLEVVSKPQIRLKGKAQVDRESAAYMGM
ncbi:MAG: hypothetical protein PVG69_00795 [Desulfobacterales bacterium]|jgi:hypothetical protein